MSKNPKHDWNDSKIIDDVDFQEEDAKQFQKLIESQRRRRLAKDPFPR